MSKDTTWESVGKPVDESVSFSARDSIYDSAPFLVRHLAINSVLEPVETSVRWSVRHLVQEFIKEAIDE